MQREIEKLLTAHQDEKIGEGNLIKRLVSALALGSSARQRVLDDIHEAAAAIGSEHRASEVIDKSVLAVIDQAILQFCRTQAQKRDA